MPGDSPIISSDVLLVLQFDPHFRIWRALKLNMIATPMVSLPVSVLRDVLTTLDVFPFQWIVDVVVVVQVVHDFVPIECLACKAKFHAEFFNFVFR